MPTLGTLKTRIAADLKRGDIASSDSRIAYAIADAVALYQRRRFWFNQARATFATAAGTEFYTTSTIPADIAEIDSLTLELSTARLKLDRVSFGFTEGDGATTANRGQPCEWAWYSNQIRISPVPDAAYTLRISYQQILEVPATDNDSNAWTTEAETLIRAAAKRILTRDVTMNAAAEAAAARAEAEALQFLRAQTAKLDSGCLAGSGI